MSRKRYVSGVMNCTDVTSSSSVPARTLWDLPCVSDAVMDECRVSDGVQSEIPPIPQLLILPNAHRTEIEYLARDQKLVITGGKDVVASM